MLACAAGTMATSVAVWPCGGAGAGVVGLGQSRVLRLPDTLGPFELPPHPLPRCLGESLQGGLLREQEWNPETRRGCGLIE